MIRSFAVSLRPSELSIDVEAERGRSVCKMWRGIAGSGQPLLAMWPGCGCCNPVTDQLAAAARFDVTAGDFVGSLNFLFSTNCPDLFAISDAW